MRRLFARAKEEHCKKGKCGKKRGLAAGRPKDKANRLSREVCKLFCWRRQKVCFQPQKAIAIMIISSSQKDKSERR